MTPSGPLPSGRVTFAFTDVVGSTKTFFAHGDVYVEAVQALQATVAEHAAAEGGVVVSTEGDGTMLAFPTTWGAIRALTALQADLESRPEGNGLRLRLRAGAHVGDAEPIGDFYVALPVYVAARVSATAGAGQVIVSSDVIDELGQPLGVPVGDFRLKDVAYPVTLWRIVGDDAPLKAVPARRTNVAEPHSNFFGREPELIRLGQLVTSGRLVTVLGTGGLGKTRLVSEFALAHAEDFEGGVWLVELAPLEHGEQIVPEIASMLGLSAPITTDVVAAEITRRGEIVMLLDNCEHLTDPVADLVDDLLRRCPSLKIVCTTREALELPQEQIFRLSALASGGPGTAEELFRDRAAAAGVTLGLSDAEAVTELCALLDGVPLALELAAGRAALEPVASLVDGLKHGDLPLTRRGGEARQRSLESLVAWSLKLLTDHEQDAVFALSVLPGRFTGEMAGEVLEALPSAQPDSARRLMVELVRKSLVDLDGAEYRMLATVAAVAGHELGLRPELHEAACFGRFHWCARPLDRSAEKVAPTPDQIRAMELALEWGLDRAQENRGRVAARLSYWAIGNVVGPATRALFDRILAEPVAPTEDSVRLNSAALRFAGGVLTTLTESAHPERALEVVVAARTVGDPEVLSLALTQAAAMQDAAGHHDLAEPLHLENVEICTELGDRNTLAIVLLDLGVSYHLAGRLDEAEEHYRRTLDYVGDDQLNASNCRINLGEVLLDRGQYAEAAAQFSDELRSGDIRPAAQAWLLVLLAEAEVRQGNWEKAKQVARQAERVLEPLVETDPSMAGSRARLRAALESEQVG